MPGRNSSGAEAATRCYNAEELLYDFLIIIIRNTSRGLLTVWCFEKFRKSAARQAQEFPKLMMKCQR